MQNIIMSRLPMNKEASFLLTEIALDLLSNKFYDINGEQVKDLESLYKTIPESDNYLQRTQNLSEILGLPSETPSGDIINILNTDNSNDVDVFDPEEQPIEIDSLLAYNNESTSNSMESEIPDENTQNDETNSQYNPEPNILLLKTKRQEDRVQYIIDWTKYEFKKILDKSEKLRTNSTFVQQIITNSKNYEKQFRQRERAQLEHESEQLISLIKIIKKSEFSLARKDCAGMLNQISVDIMTSKSKICSDPSVCI